MDANLLITCDPSHSGKAKDEVTALLKDAGEKATFIDSDVEGLLLLKVKDAKKAVKELIGVFNDDSSRFELTFKWTPIDKWCSSDLASLSNEMKKFDAKIGADESWKMDLNKRQYQGSTTDLIMKLTENITKPKVDLKNPQKIVKVEIIGENAGIALLDASELLDVPKMKR
ncbi:MAG: THUMP domain-containing protein [Candidatus Aenigmatarchaeota archaeon]